MGAREAGGRGLQTRGEAQAVPVWEQQMGMLGHSRVGGATGRSSEGKGGPRECGPLR